MPNRAGLPVIWVGTDIDKGVYYALVLTVRNPEKISKFVKNKATVNAPWLWYTQPSLCQGHWCTRTPMATLGTAGLLVYIQRGALTLLASTNRAILRSLRVWSEQQYRASRFFYVFLNCLLTCGICSPKPSIQKWLWLLQNQIPLR